MRRANGVSSGALVRVPLGMFHPGRGGGGISTPRLVARVATQDFTTRIIDDADLDGCLSSAGFCPARRQRPLDAGDGKASPGRVASPDLRVSNYEDITTMGRNPVQPFTLSAGGNSGTSE